MAAFDDMQGLPLLQDFFAPDPNGPAPENGIDWISPYRLLNQSATDGPSHDQCVEAALTWLRSSPIAWFEAFAAAAGAVLWSDGNSLAAMFNGNGWPARLTWAWLACWGDRRDLPFVAADLVHQVKGTLQ